MGATKAQLIIKLRNRLSSTTDDALLTAATLLDDLNSGLAAFADEREWPWLNTTASIAVAGGDNEYDLPDGYTHIHSLSINNDPLMEVRYDDYLQTLKAQSTGQPLVYTRIGDTIKLAPSPDTAYTLEAFYQQEEVTLASDGDETLAPTRYASIIATYGAIYSAVRIRDTANIAAMYQLRKDELQRVYDAMQLSDVGPRIQTRNDMRP